MDITNYIKAGKNIVIELYNGAEYIVTPEAVEAIKRDDKYVKLIVLYGGKTIVEDIKQVEKAFLSGKVVDYIDQK